MVLLPQVALMDGAEGALQIVCEILTTASAGRCWCCVCSGAWCGFLRNLQPLLRGETFWAMITASPVHRWFAGDGCGGRHETGPGLSVHHHPTVRRIKAPARSERQRVVSRGACGGSRSPGRGSQPSRGS